MFVPGLSKSRQSSKDSNEDTLLHQVVNLKVANGHPIANAATEKEGKTTSPTRDPAMTDTAPQLWKKKIQRSESSIQKLKVHAEKKTCPKTEVQRTSQHRAGRAI